MNCLENHELLGFLCSSCPGKQPTSPLHMYESTEQILQRYLHTVFPGAFRLVTVWVFPNRELTWNLKVERVLVNFIHLLPSSTSHVLEQPCSTLPPYPQFFSPLLTRQGFLLDKPPSYSSTGNNCPLNFATKRDDVVAVGFNRGKRELLKKPHNPFEHL